MNTLTSIDEFANIHLHVDPITVNVVHRADPELIELIKSLKGDIAIMSATVQQALDELTADVTQETTVDQSAVTLIQGMPALISAAVASALAAGATPAQLAAFDALNVSLQANATALAAAVTAGSGTGTGTGTGGTPVSPAITAQPAAASVAIGSTGSFSVVATGTPAPTYQWNKNGVAIPGATSSSYVTPATVAADNGASFTVTVTNSAGSVTSTPVVMSVA